MPLKQQGQHKNFILLNPLKNAAGYVQVDASFTLFRRDVVKISSKVVMKTRFSNRRGVKSALILYFLVVKCIVFVKDRRSISDNYQL